jgi:hypothetical protein
LERSRAEGGEAAGRYTRKLVDVKTVCLYNGNMKLLNVRLNEADAKIAAQLRRDGVEISTLMRQALRAEFERRHRKSRKARKPSEIIVEIIARHPTPPGTPPRDYNVHDRHEAREAILRKMRGARRRSA